MEQLFIFYHEGVQAIDNRTVTEGGNVTLTCQTYGRSFQSLTWFKPDGQSGGKTVLELVNISRNEAGEYRCEVHSECGNETETVNIDVQCKRIFISFLCLFNECFAAVLKKVHLMHWRFLIVACFWLNEVILTE